MYFIIHLLIFDDFEVDFLFVLSYIVHELCDFAAFLHPEAAKPLWLGVRGCAENVKMSEKV